MKTQDLRLVDVFLLGPFMLWFAIRSEDVPDWARLAMGASAIATMAFNGRNWERYRK